MQINGSNQMINFLYSIIMGIFLCIIYDVIRILRKLFNTNIFIINTEDVIFSLFSSFVVFGMVLVNREGKMRAFIIFGIFIGVLVFELTLGNVIVSFFGKYAEKFNKYVILKIKATYKFIKISIKNDKSIERFKKIVYNNRK